MNKPPQKKTNEVEKAGTAVAEPSASNDDASPTGTAVSLASAAPRLQTKT
jgi:hypothetical protein